MKYYKNLDDETISAPSKDIAKEVVRELLRKSEEFFHKGTREDAALGVFYRKIAKDILDTL